jgi:ATPase
MFSEELARPVVVITSFLSKQVQYEIYTFGEQIVVMPILE